jgi:hypothetical protein
VTAIANPSNCQISEVVAGPGAQARVQVLHEVVRSRQRGQSATGSAESHKGSLIRQQKAEPMT